MAAFPSPVHKKEKEKRMRRQNKEEGQQINRSKEAGKNRGLIFSQENV